MSEPATRFVGESIAPDASFDPVTISHGEPSLPSSFHWRNEVLGIVNTIRAWRSTKIDRGEAYLARHWYEVVLADGRKAVVYFDRHARRGKSRWWLYTIE